MESISGRVRDEVSVCLLSAVYSSWPASRQAPPGPYGRHLFQFFGREREKNGGHSGDLRAEKRFEGFRVDVLGFSKALSGGEEQRLVEPSVGRTGIRTLQHR